MVAAKELTREPSLKKIVQSTPWALVMEMGGGRWSLAFFLPMFCHLIMRLSYLFRPVTWQMMQLPASNTEAHIVYMIFYVFLYGAFLFT